MTLSLLYSHQPNMLKSDFDSIEQKFQNMSKMQHDCLEILQIGLDGVEARIKSVELDSLAPSLKESCAELKFKVERFRADDLSLLRTDNLINFVKKTKPVSMKKCVGSLQVKNEFTLSQKVYYINFMNDLLHEFDLIQDLSIAFHLINVIFISEKIIFYHFKSSENLLGTYEDKLIVSDPKSQECLKQLVSKYQSIVFSKYQAQGRYVLACFNDFKNGKHFLTMYDDEFNNLGFNDFKEAISLVLVNSVEIICHVPTKFLVFNYKLELVNTFQKATEFGFSDKRFSILHDSSRNFFYFKFTDDLTNKIFVSIVKKMTGREVKLLEIESDDYFKADFASDVLFIKNVFLEKIRVLDVKSGKQFSRCSEKLRNFYFVSITEDGHLYSVNYSLNKIVYI